MMNLNIDMESWPDRCYFQSSSDPAQDDQNPGQPSREDKSMSVTTDQQHLADVCAALQRRENFSKLELGLNRGRGSRVAAIVLERAMRLAPAALGRILCACPEALHWADYTKVWPTQSAQATTAGDEVLTLRLKVAFILAWTLGSLRGVYAGDGWGNARTGYTLADERPVS
jgi:hypothetical protein